VTVTQGTNTIVGCNPARIVTEALAVLGGKGKAGRTPELWDGRAAGRIVDLLMEVNDGLAIVRS
jgi:UDP-N-acetylglucosamine 2-epimerase (non-hydrolysing)